jgi:rRNA maturation endonuclease Nob1
MPFIPPQSTAIREALDKPNQRLLHCLNCGGQVVAMAHDGCRICGSRAVLIERID